MKQKLTETETGSRNYSKYERHLSEVCNTCHRYDLVITPGLETLQIEAVQQKMTEMAKFLKLDLKDAMKIQRTPWVEADKVKMEDLYTRLRIEKHTKKPQRTMKEELVNYCELFKNLNENRRILIKGNPGIGKTTFSRKMVFDWASDMWDEPELNSIVLLFLVTLKYINDSQKLEDMIKQQHNYLTLNDNVPSGLLKEIIEKCGEQCLVILEGYDEIPEGCKAVLDPIVKKQVYRDCHFLITSRPNAVESLEYYMSSIASIEGFSKENTRKYIEKVIEDPSKWQAAFKYTENSAIEDMWRYPILVLFLCLLVNWGAVDLDEENLEVGEFYKRLLNCIYRRFIVEKIEKEKQDEEEAKQEETLLKIGKIAFKGLLSNKVTYRKGEILKAAGPKAFQFGILIGTDEWEGHRDIPENADIFVYFVHKSIQEYLAAKYLMHQLQKGKSIEKLVSGKNATTKFIQNNLMFFSFCGYFTNIDNTPDADSDTESDSDEDISNDAALRNMTAEHIRGQLVDFIAKCFDEQELKLEGVAIYEESSWLFLEALPKCSNIKELVLKDMELKVSLLFILQGISQSLEYLHIDSCVFGRTTEDGITITFPKLKTLKLSGKRGGAYLLTNSAWSGVEMLDLMEYKLNRDDIKIIHEANKHGYLQSVKEIVVSDDTYVSGYVRELLNNEWPSLKTFDMEECNLTGDDISAIHEAHKKGYLPSIDLTVKSGHISDEEDDLFDGSGSYDESIQAWHVPVVPVMCGAWKEQEVLDLSDCEFSNQDVITIAEANRHGLLPSVKEVNLMGNKNVPGHLSTLLSSPWLLLSKLTIEHHKLVKEDISAIGEATNKGFLPSVDLTEKSLSSSGHIPIVSVMCGAWRELEALDLGECKFSTQDVTTIVEANRCGLMPSVKAIKDLGEAGNARYLNTLFSQPWSSLEILDMSIFSEQDVKIITEANKNGILPSIKEIIGLERVSGTEQFSIIFSHPWKSLEILDMRRCCKQDVITIVEANRCGLLPSVKDINGLDRIADNKQLDTLFSHPWKSLETLDLKNCNEQDMMTITGANNNGLLPSVNQIISLERVAYTKQLGELFSHRWKWISLEILDMTKCDKQDVITIAEANRCGVLSSVKEINLMNNFNIAGQVPTLLSNIWPVLKALDMQKCNLTKDDISWVHKAHEKGFLPIVDLTVSYSLSDHIPVVPVMCGAWREQEVLDLRECKFSEQDVIAITEAKRHGLLPSVGEINLSGNKNVSGHMNTLLSDKWSLLKTLDITDCNLARDDISSIREANEKGFLPSMKKIKLSRNKNVSGHMNIFFTNKWPLLKTLDITDCNLARDGISAIHEANEKGFLPSMKEINLSRNKDLSGHMNNFFTNKWPLLKTLDLEECNLTRDDISAIHEAKEKGYLPIIDVRVKFFSPSGHIPVVPVMCGAWREHEVLDLNRCKFSQQDVITIAEANRHGLLTSVIEINLSHHMSTSGHIDSLLSSKWQSLQKLHLECNLTVEDIRALGEANRNGYLPSIHVLNLSINHALSGTLTFLLSHTWPVMQKLNLPNCNLTVEDIRALGEANEKGCLPSLQMLDLHYNRALSGQLALLFTHTWPVLHKLDLTTCNLTGEDIRALGEANRKGYLPSLLEMILWNNEALSGRLTLLFTHTWPVLQELDLRECDLTSADGDTLLDACKQGRLPQLKKLYISNYSFSGTNNIPSDKIAQLKEHIEDVRPGWGTQA